MGMALRADSCLLIPVDSAQITDVVIEAAAKEGEAGALQRVIEKQVTNACHKGFFRCFTSVHVDIWFSLHKFRFLGLTFPTVCIIMQQKSEHNCQ